MRGAVWSEVPGVVSRHQGQGDRGGWRGFSPRVQQVLVLWHVDV